MRIGLNLLYLLPGVVGGTETYAVGLLQGLSHIDKQNEYLIFLNREAKNWQLPTQDNFIRLICPVSGKRRWERFQYEQMVLPRLLRKHNLNVIHSLGYVGPLFTYCPSIVTIHDLNYQAFGSQMPFIRRMALKFFVYQSAHRSTRIITVSEFSKNEILKAFNLHHQKVIVTWEAPLEIFQPRVNGNKIPALFKNLGIRNPYAICFSSRSANKNIPKVIDAFKLTRKRDGIPHQLILIGHLPFDQHPPTDDVVYTGFLEPSVLEAVLCNAEFLLFPSIYEGFGLPVVEAMACGVPVVCSNYTVLPEIAGEAALYFDPFSIDDMADKISTIAGNIQLRKELQQKGYDNIQRFSWDETANKTLEVYKSLLIRSRH